MQHVNVQYVQGSRIRNRHQRHRLTRVRLAGITRQTEHLPLPTVWILGEDVWGLQAVKPHRVSPLFKRREPPRMACLGGYPHNLCMTSQGVGAHITPCSTLSHIPGKAETTLKTKHPTDFKWLRLPLPLQAGAGSVPSRETKILRAAWRAKK